MGIKTHKKYQDIIISLYEVMLYLCINQKDMIDHQYLTKPNR